MGQEIPVVGDLDHGRRLPCGVGEGHLEEAGDGAVQDAEAVLAPLHLKERPVDEVDRHHIPDEPVELKNIELELPVGVPGLIREQEVDIIVEVPPGLVGAAGESEVDPVVDRLVASIQGAVQIRHAGVALVDVLGREAEHVVVEPVGAHGLVPVARVRHDAAVVIRGAAAGIGGVRIDGVVPGTEEWPVVVVELAGVEEGPGEAVILRTVVRVVLVGADGVPPEAPVLGHVGRELVVVAEEDRLIVAGERQLGRQRPVEGPQRQGVLVGQSRVEGRPKAGCGIDAGVEVCRHPRIVHGVDLGPLLRDLDAHRREELLPPLVRPELPRRASLDRAEVVDARDPSRGIRRHQRGVQALQGGVRQPRGDGVQDGDRVARQDIEPWHGLREGGGRPQRAWRQARRDLGVGARGKGAQPVRRDQQAPRRDEAPLDEVPSGDLADGVGLNDLYPVLSGMLCFSQPSLRCVPW
ncbi:MAG: hypothetical protein M5R38_14160 [Candidatus Methylomirabilis sp.]|nr:hypothetical protein [Candidatus Methylomirabilis sp.]